MPGPVQVYDTGVAVVEAMALTVVVVQVKVPLTEAETGGMPALCVTTTLPGVLQPLDVLVTV
jgi:hypothetical protein